jgi:hypothetical protein
MKILLTVLCLLISFASLGQEGKYLKDAKTGCLVWDPTFDTGDSIIWTGDCRNNYANGIGTVIWLSNGKEFADYSGEMLNGIPNGKGTYTYSNGHSITGNFSDGEPLFLDAPYLERLEKNSIPIIDSTHIFLNAGESKTLFYYALVPKNTIKGVSVLLPSTGETPQEVLSNNVKLVELACDSGLLTIVPSVNHHICLDNNVLDFLNATFSDVVKKYNVPKDKFVIGGLSLGGMLALRYTEYAYDNSARYTTIIPKAVFGADPPVDLVTLYRQFTGGVARNFSTDTSDEARFYLANMRKQFGGTPEQQPATYIKYSMYSLSEKDGGNARFLKNVPIRIYSDPDIDWQMKNKHRDYYDMNAPDQTAMIIELQLMGNDKAEFINALGKGFRLDGTRHPHSWSIVEPTDCIAWIMKCIE